MPRKLPLCAWCGKPLGDTCIRLTFEDFPGRPEVGWHMPDRTQETQLYCDLADGHFPGLASHEQETPLTRYEKLTMLKAIERRGEGRLVANKAWRN